MGCGMIGAVITICPKLESELTDSYTSERAGKQRRESRAGGSILWLIRRA